MIRSSSLYRRQFISSRVCSSALSSSLRSFSTHQKLSEENSISNNTSSSSSPVSTPISHSSSLASIQARLNLSPKEILLLNKLKIKENPAINFERHRAEVFTQSSLTELFRSFFVFQLCQMPLLVRHSESLIRASYKILGKSVTNALLKSTFYGHFCAGEDQAQVQKTVDRLLSKRVGSIFDYAAENDLDTSDAAVSSVSPHADEEKTFQTHKNIFLQSIQTCHQSSIASTSSATAAKNFVAVKITALTSPELLRKVSTVLDAYNGLFDGSAASQKVLQAAAASGLTVSSSYVAFVHENSLKALNDFAISSGILSSSQSLSDEEMLRYEGLYLKVHEICALAKRLEVKLMIDAEHTYFQPAIDHVTIHFAKRFNRLSSSPEGTNFQSFFQGIPGAVSNSDTADFFTSSTPIVFNTYQMYLKSSGARVLSDLAYSQSSGFSFCLKLVRGAYMVIERQYATEHGRPDPIHDTIENTHDNYNETICHLIGEIYREKSIEVMLASHNQFSIENSVQTVAHFHELSQELQALAQAQGESVSSSSSASMSLSERLASLPVFYGQLLGMSDDLTLTLGRNGYKAFKYVPYGKVEEVMPYLIRRAQENSGGLSGATKELKLIKNELKKRFFGF